MQSEKSCLCKQLLFSFRHAESFELRLEFNVLLIYHLFIAWERLCCWSDVELRKFGMLHLFPAEAQTEVSSLQVHRKKSWETQVSIDAVYTYAFET